MKSEPAHSTHTHQSHRCPCETEIGSLCGSPTELNTPSNRTLKMGLSSLFIPVASSVHRNPHKLAFCYHFGQSFILPRPGLNRGKITKFHRNIKKIYILYGGHKMVANNKFRNISFTPSTMLVGSLAISSVWMAYGRGMNLHRHQHTHTHTGSFSYYMETDIECAEPTFCLVSQRQMNANTSTIVAVADDTATTAMALLRR